MLLESWMATLVVVSPNTFTPPPLNFPSARSELTSIGLQLTLNPEKEIARITSLKVPLLQQSLRFK
jgi:hypothetical protein